MHHRDNVHSRVYRYMYMSDSMVSGRRRLWCAWGSTTKSSCGERWKSEISAARCVGVCVYVCTHVRVSSSATCLCCCFVCSFIVLIELTPSIIIMPGRRSRRDDPSCQRMHHHVSQRCTSTVLMMMSQLTVLFVSLTDQSSQSSIVHTSRNSLTNPCLSTHVTWANTHTSYQTRAPNVIVDDVHWPFSTEMNIGYRSKWSEERWE